MFTFIESAAFDRMRANYLDDDEYRELQDFLLTLCSKTTRENAPAHILKKLKEAFEND